VLLSGELYATTAHRTDTVLLSGELYATTAHRTDIENLADAQGLTMRCRDPELAVVRGLLLLEDFGLLRIATGPAPARTHFPPPLEDPEPQPWPTPVADPEPQNAPPDNAPKGPGAVPTPPPDSEPPAATSPHGRGAVPDPPRGRERPSAPHSEPPTATTPPNPTPEPEPEPEPEAAPEPEPAPAPAPEPETPRPEPASTLRSVPVTQLQAIRRDDHLLVLWAWPDSALTARVRWRREDVTTAGGGPRDGDIR
ncbi:hypothetical protein AB4Z54_46325, partial [Streptomyces sp. MCAF7]